MDTQKVDLYANIHRGMRNLIGRFSLQAGATDWTDPAAIARLGSQWEQTKLALHAHHTHEDEVVHPLLARTTPGGHRSFEADHKAQQVVLDDPDAHFQRLARGEVAEARRPELGLEFYRCLNLFYADYLRHLYREEAEAQRTLDALCTPQELVAALGAIIGGMPMDELLFTIDYRFPALTLSECLGLLAPMKGGMPPEVFNTLAGRVRQVRGEEDWSQLQRMGLG